MTGHYQVTDADVAAQRARMLAAQGDVERRTTLARAIAVGWTADVASVVADSVLNQADRLREMLEHYRITGTPVNRDVALLNQAAMDLLAVRDARDTLRTEQISNAKLPDVGEPVREEGSDRVHWDYFAVKDPGTEPLEGWRIVRRHKGVHMTAERARAEAAELIAAADYVDAQDARR